MNLPKDQACPHCGRYDNRGTTIDAVIVKNGKVLLIKRGVEPDKGKWATPGGYLGWDESLEDAVIREVKEETGLSVANPVFVKVSSNPSRHPLQTVNHVYLVKTDSDEVNAGDDAKEFKWFDLNDLPKDLAFDHRENIEEAKKLL